MPNLIICCLCAGLKPNETTYIFFGRRGSGKTTIRLQMEAGYKQYNDRAISAGGKGLFMIDICRYDRTHGGVGD